MPRYHAAAGGWSPDGLRARNLVRAIQPRAIGMVWGCGAESPTATQWPSSRASSIRMGCGPMSDLALKIGGNDSAHAKGQGQGCARARRRSRRTSCSWYRWVLNPQSTSQRGIDSRAFGPLRSGLRPRDRASPRAVEGCATNPCGATTGPVRLGDPFPATQSRDRLRDRSSRDQERTGPMTAIRCR